MQAESARTPASNNSASRRRAQRLREAGLVHTHARTHARTAAGVLLLMRATNEEKTGGTARRQTQDKTKGAPKTDSGHGVDFVFFSRAGCGFVETFRPRRCHGLTHVDSPSASGSNGSCCSYLATGRPLPLAARARAPVFFITVRHALATTTHINNIVTITHISPPQIARGGEDNGRGQGRRAKASAGSATICAACGAPCRQTPQATATCPRAGSFCRRGPRFARGGPVARSPPRQHSATQQLDQP